MISLALITAVAACGGPAAGPHASSSSPAPSISPVAASSPSATWSLGLGPTAISTVDFSCRLPVFVDIGSGQPGAFVDFPSATVTPDPAAGVGSLSRPGRELVGYFYVRYYDRAYSLWLPVSRSDVSPDGAHYAYTDRALSNPQHPPTRATLHVVAVKTGVERAFDDGAWSAPYEILDYAAEGIYLIRTYGVYVGLWLMDPNTGAIRRVANLSNIQGSAGNKVVWVGTINPSDPHPVAGVAPDQLDKVSLVDRSRVAWFYRPGSAVHFVSQDVAGDPIINVTALNGPDEFLLLLGPGISKSILTGGDRTPSLGSPISDKHGVWFGSPDGIFLYSEANGLQKVSNQPGYPGNGCL
jgi:hypothetical protein